MKCPLLLIPVTYSLPAVRAYLDAQPYDGSALTEEELQALARLTERVIETSELLVDYAVALSGKPSMN